MCLTAKKIHDQTFATYVLKEMLETVENMPKSCIIESSNCCSLYKSAQHFDNIQNICNKIGVPIIRLVSVTGHVKGKSIILGDWQNAQHVNMWEQGVKFLMQLISRIFLELCLLRNQILFFLKLIDVDDLADSQAEARLKKYMTIAGSDSCQVIVFQSNSITFKAAFHLCICDL